MNTIPLYGPISNDTLHPGTMHQLLGGSGVCYWKQLINGMHLERNLHCVEFVLVPPGASIGLHTHDRTEEIYYLLRGGATMSVNGESRQVQAGDLLTTPIGCQHGIANTSEQVMAFFVVEVFPGRAETTREPVHIPLQAQMQACTSPRNRNGTIWAASLDLSYLLSGNWADFAVAEISPAGRLGPYALSGRDEVLFVVEGRADIVFGDDHVSGGAGLCLAVPAEMPRSIHNASSTEPLEVLWTEVYRMA